MIVDRPAGGCESPPMAAVVDSLAFPVAVYDALGALLHANRAFQTLWERLAGVSERDRCRDLAAILMHIGYPGPIPMGFHDTVSSAGTVASFALDRVTGGGWTLTGRDVTAERLAERKAERSQKVALVALADLAEHRDNDTGEHVLRVARLTHEIARHLHGNGPFSHAIDAAFLRHVGMASILHDVGKVSIPDHVLLKPGRLTPDERTLMERHAANGAVILRKAESMLAGSAQFRLAAEIAEYHHERWNGAGYPHGLAGEDIPLAARIVGVADVYDALMSRRPYKEPWPEADALDHIRERAGVDFDPRVVAALEAVVASRARSVRLEWTPAMAIGDASVDADHQVLLALVNQISAEENREDAAAVEFVLDELLGYTALHFAREEELMARIGFPDLDHHRLVHQSMIGEVRRMQHRLMVSFTPRLGDDLHRFLGRWLTSHILGEDRQYVPFLISPAEEDPS